MKDITYEQLGAERTVVCRCANCSEKFDGVVQHKDVMTSMWLPSDIDALLASVGWKIVDDRVYCSQRCTILARMAKPVASNPVQRIADASYQRAADRFKASDRAASKR